jgi:FKBP-type peptidyl-prolyl cis-trans isomerase SlyD
MNVSEEADVLVEPKDAYGELNPEAVQTLPKEQFAGIELKEGMSLYGTGEQGETVQVTVTGFNDNEVTIDYNHPMAGKTLMFSVAILSSRAATEEEIQTGVVGGMAAMGGGGCCGGGSHDHGSSEGGCCSSEPKEEAKSHGGCGCSH